MGTSLSLRLPRREEPFADHECRPFFSGLIPEGDFPTAIARAFHVAAENPFAILTEIGGECAGAVSLVPRARSRQCFLDALLFNLVIGNCDAHAKNYSLLLEGREAPRLAPLYDLLSTRVYPELRNRKMAMKYGGEYRADRIRGRHLDRLAADLEIAPRGVRHRTAEVIERLRAARGIARDDLAEPWQSAELLDRIDTLIVDSTEMLRRALAEN